MLEKIKQFWEKLNPRQKKQVKITAGGIVIIALVMMLFSTNDTEAFSKTSNNFIKATANYDPVEANKYTTGVARQLVAGQEQKIKKIKMAGYQTSLDKIETKVVSQKKNSMIASVRVITTEKKLNGNPQKFSHLFIVEGQKVGSTWKISNVLEAEAKLVRQ